MQGYSQSFVQIGSDTINKYSAITSIIADDDNNVDSVVVVNAGAFSVDDTVMIYCAKGAAIGLGGLYPVGEDAQDPRNTGKYAFLLIDAIVGNTVILNATVRDEIRPMGPGEMAQLIRVPSYKNAEVTSLLTSSPWNPVTGEGGVVTMFVSGILRISADIDVSGEGLWGARVSSDPFLYGGDCSSVDTDLYDSAFYQFDNVRSGLKGEGTTDTTFYGLRGKASSINGGGGGNALFAGGGGGSNFSKGVTGGNESTACGPGVAETGGKGGFDLGRLGFYYVNGNPGGGFGQGRGNRIFFGGGGGTGVRMAIPISTDGGNGGGIVVIVADTLEGNGGSIIADGGDVGGVATGAAGGGGGGGAIILDVNGYKGTLPLSAVGGDGGNTIGGDTLGMGGAGGGGIYWLAGSSHPGVSPDFSFGTNGVHISVPAYDPLDAPRQPAQRDDLEAPLRGFLFNPVPSEFTVCSDQDPDPIVTSVPKGGDNTYTYQWVDSTSISGDWNDIVGATSKDYNPGPLADTTYFRRIVSSVGLVDTSFRIAVYVHPAITNNTIAAPDTVCSGNAPGLFESSQMTDGPPWIGGGPTGGTFMFKWQEMEEGAGSYTDITGITEDSTYQAGGLTTSTDYRRIAYAGVCVDTSTELHVRVLEPLTGNDITPVSEATPYDTICFNTAPESISGPVPSGGEAADIRYQWLSSDNPLLMGSILAGETGQSFQSSALSQTTYFRRIVLSGNDDACTDTSAYVEVLNIPYITAGTNVISADETLCQGIQAASLAGSSPSGAYTGSYSFLWLSSTDSASWAQSLGDPAVETGYEPGIMGGPTTWYRRQVGWGGQELVCKDTSSTVKITVLDSITNNLLAPLADQLCQGLMPENIIGQTPGGEATLRTYAWYMLERVDAPGESDWGAPVVSGPAERDYLDPGQLVTDTDRWYRRIVTSGPGGECLDTSSVFHLAVHSEITANAIDTDQNICFNDTRALRGFAPTGGELGLTPVYTWRTWQQGQDSTDAVDIAGSDQEAYVAGPFDVPGELTVYFDRVLEIGACRDTSGHMQVDIMQLPGGALTVADFDTCSGYLVDLDIMTNLNAGNPGYPAETGTYPWTVYLKHGAATGIGPFTLGGATLADPADILVDVLLDADGASYVQRIYEIESISFYPEADAYACVAPPGNITGGPLAIGVYHTPEPQIMVDQQARESLRVCNSILTLQIDDPDNGTGTWVFDPSQDISQQEVATDEYEISIDDAVKSAFTVLGEPPYRAVYASQADATGCIGYDSIDLYFYEQPAPAYAGEDTLVFLVNSIQLKADPPTAGSGEWILDGTGIIENDTLHNTFVHELGEGESNFTWTVRNGEGEGLCSSSSDISIVIRSDVNRYQGFSPNGDMDNEYFIMQGLPYSDDFTFTVFNSLGSLVRTVTKEEAENMDVDEAQIQNGLAEDEMVVWDGRANNGNMVPSGTYYYVITFFMHQRDYQTGDIYRTDRYEIPDYVVVVRE
jgi:hypothetical protein